MSDQLNPNIGRRNLLRVLAAGAGVAAAGTVPLVVAAQKPADAAKYPKPRYRADSPEVQTFYRVNRYPAK